MTSDTAPPSPWQSWERRLTPLMFALGVVFLGLLAWLLQRVQTAPDPTAELLPLSWVLGGLWLPFALEFLAYLTLHRPRQSGVPTRWSGLWPVLVPPLRIALRSRLDPGRAWLPGPGFFTVTPQRRERLERLFGLPMIGIALLILPVLGAELLWHDVVVGNALLLTLLDSSTAFIWFAFALEFLIMAGVAENRFRYCLGHWLELLIILLPFVAFLRGVRILQAARVTRLWQAYRLRGVLMRSWRALVMLGLLQRLLHRNPARLLAKLEQQARDKERELEALRREIHQVRERLAARGQSAMEENSP